ncbi:glycosyltransferase family 4 protein [Mangrovimonas spongiae]|uniref:Glycosyltransferase n=1 Tax=Mangrovimonas spongiae TaxID=2494697 RepID=A0A3R9NYL8_9FLAO|nr:glycosyltransferase family 4 protein [Mangrovimonas spongiae]RSK40505.1 glycosyltransferase [Mangrovimonas spongiae]
MKANASLKIAIYSGTIPSSIFIEHLIEGVAKHHHVLLFGTIKKATQYNHPNITIVETPTKQLRNIGVTGIRSLKLFFKSPKLLNVAFREALTYKTRYEQWMRFSRFVPVLLHQPHVFHLQWAKKLSRWLFLQDAYGCKLVLSLRGTHIHISPKADVALAQSYYDYFPKVDTFHAVSQDMKTEALSYGATADNVKTIYTILPDAVFNHFTPAKAVNETLNIVSVGRYHWVKGYDYALRAIKLLKAQGIQVTYTIIASKPVPEDMLFMINDLSLEDVVVFKDHVPQDALFPYLKTFDVFLLPSLSEGIANVVLEAMAIGLPVVSTNCGGMPEVVTPNQTGWLVPIRDPEAMAKAIIEVHQTPKEQLQMITRQAHDFVKTQFNAKDNIQQFLALYDTVVRNYK